MKLTESQWSRLREICDAIETLTNEYSIKWSFSVDDRVVTFQLRWELADRYSGLSIPTSRLNFDARNHDKHEEFKQEILNDIAIVLRRLSR